MRRLSRGLLPELPPSVRQPQYDRERLKIGMAHIGVGAFHRCHQEEFIDDMLEARFGRWGVLGVNLMAPSLTELLAPQDCLYSRTLRQDAQAETRIIGALRQVIDIADKASADAAVAALGGSEISVATISVTEKGYCLTPSTGALELDNPTLRADLDGGFPPRTLLGVLALALDRRRQTGGTPLTVISCDNVPSNGARLGAAMLKFAALRSAELTRWIEESVTFPSTMVDRIVPATAPEDIDKVSEALGVRDPGAVVGEPFRQWLIEDKFAGERPPLDLAGATFVADAKPYEEIKMRVLNAAQSTLAHQGALVGHEFTYQAAADPVLAALTRKMLERETSTTLPKLAGM
jgi:fructuronate reductase